MNELKKLVPVTEVARRLGVSKHIAAQLPVRALRLGRRTYLFAGDVEALLGGAAVDSSEVTVRNVS